MKYFTGGGRRSYEALLINGTNETTNPAIVPRHTRGERFDHGGRLRELPLRAGNIAFAALDLQRITAVVQDWGGPTGLYQAAHMPERYERLVVLNTWLENPYFEWSLYGYLWNGLWQPADTTSKSRLKDSNPLRAAFTRAVRPLIVRFLFNGDTQPCGIMVVRSTMDSYQDAPTNAAAEIYEAYEAPFPSIESKAGPRRFPLSLPLANPAGGNAAEQARNYETLQSWTKPIHFIWRTQNPIFHEKWLETWSANYAQASVDRIAQERSPSDSESR